MAYGLDTNFFPNAFYHITNHRGLPQKVTSDSDTNFAGANTKLKEKSNKLDNSKIEKSPQLTMESNGISTLGSIHILVVFMKL